MEFETAYKLVVDTLESVLKNTYQYLDARVRQEVNFKATYPQDNASEIEARVLSSQLAKLKDAKNKGEINTLSSLTKFLETMKGATERQAYGTKVGLHLLSATIKYKTFDMGNKAKTAVSNLIQQIKEEDNQPTPSM